MIRSDYRLSPTDAVKTPRAAAPRSVVPVRRPLARARAAADADPRLYREPALRPRRRRGGLGEEPPGPRVRPRGRRLRGARALRRVRRLRPAPVRRVRR